MVSFSFSCFLCDRSSRWDSELCAQLPGKPNPRGDWAPVGGRTRRTERRGSCQGRPDSSRHISLQRPDVHFGHRGKTEENSCLLQEMRHWTEKKFYIIAGIFLGADGFARVHSFCKESVIESMEKFKLKVLCTPVEYSRWTSEKEQTHKTIWVRSIIWPCPFLDERFGVYTSLPCFHSAANIFRFVLLLKYGLFLTAQKVDIFIAL